MDVLPPEDESRSQTVVPVLAGIGNAVMALPLMEALATIGPVVVAARTGAMGGIFENLPNVGVVVLGGKPARLWGLHRELAKQAPARYVVPFPSNRWQYVMLAATSGARQIVLHDYPVGGRRTMRSLLARRPNVTLVPADRSLHDVEQNLLLASAAGADVGDNPRPPRIVLRDDERAGHSALSEAIVLQPGCGNTVVGRAKRWPVERFALLADALADEGHRVIVIEGPDERGIARALAEAARTPIEVVELRGTIRQAASMLATARLFVGTDSGLAHVSAAVGTPAVTLFAAADPARVAPYGCADLVVTPNDVDGRPWSPRLLYPWEHPGPRLRDDGIDWARHIAVEDVLAAVDHGLGRGAPSVAPEPEAVAEPR